jgi:restriction endonuclease S subunit
MAVWSRISTSDLVGALRLDAEFWQPAFLAKEKQIRAGRHIALGSLVSTFKKGIFYILAREYADQGIPFYRSSNVGAILPKDNGLAFITPAKHKAEYKTALETGDLMMVKTGRSGASVVLAPHCNVSQDVIAIKVRRERANPYFLAVYLNTSYGSSEMNRWFQGQVQPHLSLDDARRIWIALVPDEEQLEIEALAKASALSRSEAEGAYQQAKELLESELGLDKLTLQKPVGFIAQFGELESSHRSDAQHYQPRFRDLIDHISTFPSARVRDIRIYNRRGFQPLYVESGPVDVVNSQHLGPKHIDYEGVEKTSATAFAAAHEAHIQQDDLLIYTTGAYIGRTNVYLSDAPALASNHVNILRLRPGIDSAYMALVFQSVVGQFQTQKHARGSAQAELYPNDIDRFVVPLIDDDTQKVIGDLVRESLVKQQESWRLLEQAKARVEQLIEEAVQQ